MIGNDKFERFDNFFGIIQKNVENICSVQLPSDNCLKTPCWRKMEGKLEHHGLILMKIYIMHESVPLFLFVRMLIIVVQKCITVTVKNTKHKCKQSALVK